MKMQHFVPSSASSRRPSLRAEQGDRVTIELARGSARQQQEAVQAHMKAQGSANTGYDMVEKHIIKQRHMLMRWLAVVCKNCSLQF